MLFPPNQGAFKADRWHQHWWYRLAMGPSGQDLVSDRVRELPVPQVPFGVVAGARGDGEGWSRIIPGDDDGTVGLDETYLRGQAAHGVFPVRHTFGMNDPRVLDWLVDFLESDATPVPGKAEAPDPRNEEDRRRSRS